MSSGNRNPESRREFQKAVDESWAERERNWIRNSGINPYDPPSRPITDPHILEIDDPYWKDVRREVSAGFDDAQDRSVGILVTLGNASHCISQEIAPRFSSDYAIRFLNHLDDEFCRDGPGIDWKWAEKMSQEIAVGAEKAYALGAFQSSAALAAVARCLKDYSTDLLLRK